MLGIVGRLKQNIGNIANLKQRGAVYIAVALFLPFAILMLGVCVDIGNLYIQKLKLQNAADSAAIVGVHRYLEMRGDVNWQKNQQNVYVENENDTHGDAQEAYAIESAYYAVWHVAMSNANNDPVTQGEAYKNPTIPTAKFRLIQDNVKFPDYGNELDPDKMGVDHFRMGPSKQTGDQYHGTCFVQLKKQTPLLFLSVIPNMPNEFTIGPVYSFATNLQKNEDGSYTATDTVRLISYDTYAEIAELDGLVVRD